MQLNHKAPETNVTAVMVEEHQLILRMIALLEKNVALAEAGLFSDWNFFLDRALPFIKDFADHFHHAKEEDVLFKALVANGMPRDNSPVAAMLMEHDQGRSFVRGMELAARQLRGSEPDVVTMVVAALAENARGYAELLRDHIEKEDTILYPLAERVLPEAVRPAIIAAYAAAEAKNPGSQEKYRLLVEGYEGKRDV
jgi:hemerythrin-like domain-containing protein